MLQRLSSSVLMYLDRAQKAGERGKACTTQAEREFYDRMQRSWTKLAASTALVERVDLFLHTLERAVRPLSLCPECGQLTELRTVESDVGRTVYTFACTACGVTEERKAIG